MVYLSSPYFLRLQKRLSWEIVSKAVLKAKYITALLSPCLHSLSFHHIGQSDWSSVICPRYISVDYSLLSSSCSHVWKWTTADVFHGPSRDGENPAAQDPSLTFLIDECNISLFLVIKDFPHSLWPYAGNKQWSHSHIIQLLQYPEVKTTHLHGFEYLHLPCAVSNLLLLHCWLSLSFPNSSGLCRGRGGRFTGEDRGKKDV